MALSLNEVERQKLDTSSKGKGRETELSSARCLVMENIVSCHVAARHIMGTLKRPNSWASEEVSEYSLCQGIQYLPIFTSYGARSV